MSKLSAEDEEQLEYIRQWYEMKEEKKRAKAVRRVYMKYHLGMAKTHLKYMFPHLAECVKLLLGKRD